MSKRNYRNNLEFVEAGFKACWHNAQDLVKGAKVLLDTSSHALALSISVLALEEMGKLFCIDGLLFARADSFKKETYEKSLKSHSTKLSVLIFFPQFLDLLASVNPLYTDAHFKKAVAIGLLDLKNKSKDILDLLPPHEHLKA